MAIARMGSCGLWSKPAVCLQPIRISVIKGKKHQDELREEERKEENTKEYKQG